MTRWRPLIGGLFLCTAAGAYADPVQTTLPDCSSEKREVEILTRQEPYYPHSAHMFCLTGRVKASFTIDRQGRPGDIEVLESEPEGVFDRSTVDTIEKWRFIPACRDGEPAEREAIQTIEFRLPEEAKESCADIVGDLDDRTANLLAEIGARYALLANYWRTGGGWSQLQAAIEEPFGEFEGDLARVADFHRQALELTTRSPQDREVDELLSDTVVALMPGSLEDDPDLERARSLFQKTRSAFDQRLERAQRMHRQLATAYEELEGGTRLESRILQLLVEPFVGDPEVPFEEAVQPQSQSFDKLERIVDFLQSNRGRWQVVDNELRFDDPEDQDTWKARWDDFLTHRHEFETAAVNSMRSFQDYSD